MDKLLHSRLFRFLVCLILVCCILVNCSPLRAEASAIVAGSVLTGTGVFATLLAMSMGVVFVDLTADLINALGESFVNHVTKSTSTDNETEILNVWIEPIQVDLDSGGISQLPPDQDDDTNMWGALAGWFTLPDELKDNFLSWGKDLINDEIEVEVEEEVTADEGNLYYDDALMPIFPEYDTSIYKYAFICQPNGYTWRQFVASSSPLVDYYFKDVPCTYIYCQSNKNSRTGMYDSWSSFVSSSDQNGSASFKGMNILWSNYDVVSGGKIISNASEPSSTSTTTVPVLPDIYVGDIPQKVQNGDFDDDDLELPFINPTKLWENQTDAVEALNNVATQLQTQTMTYQQYMEQIKTGTNTNPGTGTDPGGSGTGGDSGSDSGSDETQPDETLPEEITDMAPFALDLRNFFPFCIPFDLYDFFTCLDAAPVAPKFHWEIHAGKTYSVDIDLSAWDEVAALFRHLELLLFVVGLAAASRKFIKW